MQAHGAGATPASVRDDVARVWHPYTEMGSYAIDPVVVVAAEGCHVYDDAGRRYVDAISGLWNVQIGHGRREIRDAVVAQMERLSYVPLNGRTHPPAVELARRLVARAPGNLARVFYATGGAEAVETAVKMARQFWWQSGRPERHSVVGLQDGWHGCTLGALAAGGIDEERAPFGPLGPGFVHVPAPRPTGDPAAVRRSCDALEELLERDAGRSIAAFVAEPVMGLGGIEVPGRGFWDRVQAVCRRHDVLVIVDEVATGFGRTGRLFACERYGIEPDLLACAKGITSGYLPLGAVLATDRVFDAFVGDGRGFVHGYTFGGHPLSCAAAIANLDVIEDEGLCERAAVLGLQLLDRLRARLDACPVVGDVRGAGLMVGIQLVDPSTGAPLPAGSEVCADLQRRGVLARPVGHGCVLPMLPPLTIPEDVADALLDHYCAALWALAERRAVRKEEA